MKDVRPTECTNPMGAQAVVEYLEKKLAAPTGNVDSQPAVVDPAAELQEPPD